MLTERISRINWKKWTRRRILLTIMIACGAGVIVFLFLLLHDPSWYEPPVIPPSEQQQVRNNLVAAEQAFTESLRAGGAFVYHIYQDDVNRWLAMRREIYPLLDDLAPPELADPFVLFEAGQITIAGRYRSGSLDAVISIDLAVAMHADALSLTVTAARLGSVRMPLSIADKLGLAEPVERSPDETWPGSPRIWGSLVAGLNVGSDAWWKNGGVVYRVLDASVARGEITITVEPRGRQETGRHRKHQSSPEAESGSKANRPASR
jgi:hypothetical protein